MSIELRVLLVFGALCTMIFMIRRIRKAQLKIEYSIFWIVMSVLILVVGVCPQPVYKLSDLIGFQSPVNMVYLIIFFILIIKSFQQTIKLSQMEHKIETLVQEIAIKECNDKR